MPLFLCRFNIFFPQRMCGTCCQLGEKLVSCSHSEPWNAVNTSQRRSGERPAVSMVTSLPSIVTWCSSRLRMRWHEEEGNEALEKPLTASFDTSSSSTANLPEAMTLLPPPPCRIQTPGVLLLSQWTYLKSIVFSGAMSLILLLVGGGGGGGVIWSYNLLEIYQSEIKFISSHTESVSQLNLCATLQPSESLWSQMKGMRVG